MKPAFLFYNISGDFLSIQMKIDKEGYKTYSFYDKSVMRENHGTGKGMVETVDDPFDIIKQYTSHPEDLIILIDDNSDGSMMDTLNTFGYKVIGSSEKSDKYEHNREKGNELAQAIGMDIPKSKHFTDWGSAKDFIDKSDDSKRYVFKADGVDLAGSGKTHVALNKKDMQIYINWLEKDQQEKNYKCDSFELQEIIDGVEVDLASWFNGDNFTNILVVDFEQKKNDGLGVPQGCYGQIITYYPFNGIYKTYFDKLKSQINGTTPNEWAINAIVSHQTYQPNFLEWTPRFGWDSTFGELALIKDAGHSIAEFFIRIAYKLPFPKNYFPLGRFSASVRLFSESTGSPNNVTCGKPIWIDKSIEDNIWLYSARADKDGSMKITGTTIGVATACGDTVDEAVSKVYNMIEPKNGLLITPDLIYSKHIGKNVNESISRLKEYNILPID
jgi:phosphoribosylamine-glycine ligase